MYRVNIISNDGLTTITAFLSGDLRKIQYTTEINKAGSASFIVQTQSPKSTPANLKLFNRVKIYRGETLQFSGFIDELRIGLNEIEVRCIGLLGLLQKRVYSRVLTNELVTDFITELVSTLNANVDTGITVGINDSASTVLGIELTTTTVFGALQRIADTYNLEFNIDKNEKLNVTSTLGTDKSSSVVFRYVSSRVEQATVYEFDVEVSGKEIVNKVFGYSKYSITTLHGDSEDVISQATYGLIEKSVNFTPVSSATQLGEEQDEYIAEHKDEFYTPVVTPNPDKIDVDSYIVGDVVGTLFDNGFIQFSGNYRIIRKTINVSENGVAQPVLDLRPEGKNLLPSTFIDDIINIDERIERLEETL